MPKRLNFGQALHLWVFQLSTPMVPRIGQCCAPLERLRASWAPCMHPYINTDPKAGCSIGSKRKGAFLEMRATAPKKQTYTHRCPFGVLPKSGTLTNMSLQWPKQCCHAHCLVTLTFLRTGTLKTTPSARTELQAKGETSGQQRRSAAHGKGRTRASHWASPETSLTCKK